VDLTSESDVSRVRSSISRGREDEHFGHTEGAFLVSERRTHTRASSIRRRGGTLLFSSLRDKFNTFLTAGAAGISPRSAAGVMLLLSTDADKAFFFCNYFED
jgi:hypothetical protein